MIAKFAVLLLASAGASMASPVSSVPGGRAADSGPLVIVCNPGTPAGHAVNIPDSMKDQVLSGALTTADAAAILCDGGSTTTDTSSNDTPSSSKPASKPAAAKQAPFAMCREYAVNPDTGNVWVAFADNEASKASKEDTRFAAKTSALDACGDAAACEIAAVTGSDCFEAKRRPDGGYVFAVGTGSSDYGSALCPRSGRRAQCELEAMCTCAKKAGAPQDVLDANCAADPDGVYPLGANAASLDAFCKLVDVTMVE